MSLTAGCGSDSAISPVEGTPRTISGRIIPVGDVGPLTRVRVIVRGLENGAVREFSGLADANGDFSFDADVEALEGNTLELIVRSDNGPQQFAPVYRRISANGITSLLRPMVIARRVVIPTGSHAGMSVEVTLEDAYAPICANLASAACKPYYGLWQDAPLLWPEEDFPIPVAFFRREGMPNITADDSATFWANVASLEAEFGRDLFRPVGVADLGFVSSSGTPVSGVAVSLDPAASPAFAGPTGRDGKIVLAIARANNTAWLRLRYIMNHELIHVLGFGHTCSWVSMMCGASPGRPAATPGDVAGFVLAYLIDKAIRTEMPTTSLADALAGERMFGSSG